MAGDRDIKLENIFIGDDQQIRLGDFGLTMSMRHEMAISPVGTVEYMAPEVPARSPLPPITSFFSPVTLQLSKVQLHASNPLSILTGSASFLSLYAHFRLPTLLPCFSLACRQARRPVLRRAGKEGRKDLSADLHGETTEDM